MDEVRELVTPFWFSRGRDRKSHVYNRRQWIQEGDSWKLCYLSLCGKVSQLIPDVRLHTRKPHCRTCEVAAVDAAGRALDWADPPAEVKEVA